MATKKIYDYLVIGAGSGGIASARRAASYGAKVAIVESGRYGGCCVNVGCVPKKIMWTAASFADALKEVKGYGFDITEGRPFNWLTVKQKRDAYIERLNGIYEKNLEKDGVEKINGIAKFINPKTVEVNGKQYEGKHVLIATGSYAWIPKDIPGARETGMISDGFFQLEYLPKKVALVGGGYIAVELAGIFNALGADTTLFIRHDEFLRTFDPIISQTVMKTYEDAGVKIIKSSAIKKVENVGNNAKKSLNIQVEVKGQLAAADAFTGFEEIVYAVGRNAHVDSLNLDVTKIKTDARGYIQVDDWQNTAEEGVYALGDVCGKAMLTPVAIAAGRRLSDRLFGNKPNSKLDYRNIPSVIFSHPPAGSVGLSENEAKEKFGEKAIKIYTSKFTNMHFALTEHKEPTVYKLICAGPDEKVVGLHIVGKASDEILQGFAVALNMGASKADFDRTVAIHPTAAEEIVTMR